MLLSVEQAFVGSECNPISPKNDCVGGYGCSKADLVCVCMRGFGLRVHNVQGFGLRVHNVRGFGLRGVSVKRRLGVGVGVNFLTLLKTFNDSEKQNKKFYINKIAGNLILS